MKALVALLAVVLLVPMGSGVWLRFGASPTQRAALTSRLLTRLLPGTFHITSFDIELPTRLHLHDVVIDAPGGDVVARAHHIDASFLWAPLLAGHVVFEDILCEQPWVQVKETGSEGMMVIETAFVRHPSQAAEPAAQFGVKAPLETGVRVELRQVNVHDADLLVAVQGIEIHATHLNVRDATYWVHGDGMSLTADIDTDVTLNDGQTVQIAQGLQLRARDIHYLTGRSYDRLDAGSVSAHLDGADVDVGGYFLITQATLQQMHADTKFAVNARHRLLAPQLPAWLARSVKGMASGTASFDVNAGRRTFALDVRGDKLSWRHIGLDRVKLRGASKDNELAIDAFHVQSGTSNIDINGSGALMPTTRFFIGRHSIEVAMNKFELQRLLGPFVSKPGLLPETVTLTATSQGRSLWPMTSEVHVQMSAWGVPASWLPGVPDPLVMEISAVMHPDMVDILRLQLGSRGTQIALQGGLPFDHLGLIDVITSLHRIPEKTRVQQAAD